MLAAALVDQALDPDQGHTDAAAPSPEVEAALEPSLEPSAPPTPEALETSLRLSRDELRRIQQSLISLGLYAGPADGLFGKNTREGLKTWQTSQKKVATGYLDVETAKTLLAALPETSITVRTVPANATVRVFTASGSTYRDAMNVQPGQYEVAVDAPDHEPFRQRLAVEGPTTYQVSLCKLETKTERICEDKPVTRTRDITKHHDRRIERSVTESVPAKLGSRVLNPSALIEKWSRVRRLCQTAEQRIRETTKDTCETLGGRVDWDSFRIVRTNCDRFPRIKIVTVVGSIECMNIPEVIKESYVETEPVCQDAMEEVRICPDQVVTKLP